MYLELDDYPTYSDRRSVIFETHIKRNLRCSHWCTKCIRHADFDTWVSKHYWEMLLSEFSRSERISSCSRKIVCNKCEQKNMRGEIFNAGDNVDDQEYFEFTESYYKIAPTNIYDYTKKYGYATREF